MSNFSNIGFIIDTQEEFLQILKKAYPSSQQIRINEGTYRVYKDGSGAQLFMQFNNKNECIGANPHYKGKSKRTVCLTKIVERKESELDGAFHCWADPSEENNPNSGAYPFVFDLPDFKTIGQIDFPKNVDVQLTAFAHELTIYDNEMQYDDSQTSDPKFAIKSFIPSGLFSFGEAKDSNSPKAYGIFTGIIKEFEKKQNELTKEGFYWLLVDTLGGEVDVVADMSFFEKAPIENGVVHGQFWLSGQLINPPQREPKEIKNIFQRIFGKK